MDLQAAKLFGAGLWQPGQDSSTPWIGLDQLFGGPQALGGSVSSNPDQALLRNTQLGQAGGMGTLGWTHQQDLAATGHQRGQCGGEQPPFAQGGLRLQQFGQCIAGPATAWQFGVQHAKTTGHHGLAGLAKVGAAPDRLGDVARKFTGIKRMCSAITRCGCCIDNLLEGG